MGRESALRTTTQRSGLHGRSPATRARILHAFEVPQSDERRSGRAKSIEPLSGQEAEDELVLAEHRFLSAKRKRAELDSDEGSSSTAPLSARPHNASSRRRPRHADSHHHELTRPPESTMDESPSPYASDTDTGRAPAMRSGHGMSMDSGYAASTPGMEDELDDERRPYRHDAAESARMALGNLLTDTRRSSWEEEGEDADPDQLGGRHEDSDGMREAYGAFTHHHLLNPMGGGGDEADSRQHDLSSFFFDSPADEGQFSHGGPNDDLGPVHGQAAMAAGSPAHHDYGGLQLMRSSSNDYTPTSLADSLGGSSYPRLVPTSAASSYYASSASGGDLPSTSRAESHHSTLHGAPSGMLAAASPDELTTDMRRIRSQSAHDPIRPGFATRHLSFITEGKEGFFDPETDFHAPSEHHQHHSSSIPQTRYFVDTMGGPRRRSSSDFSGTHWAKEQLSRAHSYGGRHPAFSNQPLQTMPADYSYFPSNYMPPVSGALSDYFTYATTTSAAPPYTATTTAPYELMASGVMTSSLPPSYSVPLQRIPSNGSDLDRGSFPVVTSMPDAYSSDRPSRYDPMNLAAYHHPQQSTSFMRDPLTSSSTSPNEHSPHSQLQSEAGLSPVIEAPALPISAARKRAKPPVLREPSQRSLASSKRVRIAKEEEIEEAFDDEGSDQLDIEDESSDEAPATSTSTKKPKKEKRTTKEVVVSCIECQKQFGRLFLRGTARALARPHEPSYLCVNCEDLQSPLMSVITDPFQAFGLAGPQAGPSSAGASPKSNKLKLPATPRRKKHKRDSDTARVSCDVCCREIGSGAVLPSEGASSVDFEVEVVCISCDGRYQRCSDCGGGGGKRFGVGKWRSKELFLDGRKTCRLGHLRLGALSEMSYDVWAIPEIPAAEVDELFDMCGKSFVNTLLAAMATPECLESGHAKVGSFQEVEGMANRGWQGISSSIRTDQQASSSIKKYLAVRWCAPNPRKLRRKVSAKRYVENATAADGEAIRHSKDLVGLVVAEYDYLIGSVFLDVVTPWSTGETFDATTLLLIKLLDRIQEDLDALNAQRAKVGQAPLPPIQHVWTMLFFKRESRMITHLEKRRGFLPLAEYLEKYPDVNKASFPPVRSVYMPQHMLADWIILVRRQIDNEWVVRSVNDPATTKKMKMKEKRAEERRALVEAAKPTAKPVTAKPAARARGKR